MGQTIVSLTHSKRAALVKMTRATSKKDLVRRAFAVLYMGECETVKAVANRIGAMRKSVARWRDWYREGGIEALASDGRGAPKSTVCPRLMAAIETALESTPLDYEYVRSRWTSEL